MLTGCECEGPSLTVTETDMEYQLSMVKMTSAGNRPAVVVVVELTGALVVVVAGG